MIDGSQSDGRAADAVTATGLSSSARYGIVGRGLPLPTANGSQ